MPLRLFLAITVCLLAGTSIAQTSDSGQSLLFGLVIGTDQVAYPSLDGTLIRSPGVTPGSWLYGIEGSYAKQRWLYGMKLLYVKRGYREEPSYFELTLNQFPEALKYKDNDLYVLSMPITVGYQFAHGRHFDWYLGGSLAFEYLLGRSDQVLTSEKGTVLLVRPRDPDQIGSRSINFGAGIQTTLCYFFTPRLRLQVEPAARYYFSSGFPTSFHNTFQFQGTAAILVKL